MWKRLGGYRQRYRPKGAGAEDANFFLRAGSLGWRTSRVTDNPLFLYHMNVGITSLPDYKEIDWRYFHPWVKDGRHPFASVARSRYHSHPVYHYDKPYVTVVIPCALAHIGTLIDALDSVEGQTVRNLQTVVVLDFDAGENIGSLMATFPWVHFVRGAGKGAGAARNLGVRHAQADRILFLDADDFLHPTALERMLSVMEEHNAIVYTDYIGHLFIDQEMADELRRTRRLITLDEKDGYATVQYRAEEYDCERAALQPVEEDKYLWCLVSSLIRKEWHEQIGGFDESMASWEDWLYWLQMSWAGICFRYLPETLMEYRFHTGARRESGRQLATGLLHYLQEKRKEAKIMPCGSCGKNRQVATPTVMAGFNRGAVMANLSDAVTVQLNDGNTGTHRIVGPGNQD